ncbi:uncharacterized protein LOC122499445 [Leptopilina heterotoma]|uniref:uncharacterized protein LOC122499445 n=1 Tax=Leptopilina heterotoma TaxID=63436 RepID=UPI001CAA3A82|nr:uncharacterized protein LOC122499445 [Leptopilina heterotoma]XP_043463750.1 uncharacterized protein LOC122499445 [Leptopilina heterotoma]XP_043463751.1 uncharacterized protein LOC122499445 [Leptopilina heterotoma]
MSDKKAPARFRGRGFSKFRAESSERRPGDVHQSGEEEVSPEVVTEASEDLIQWENVPHQPPTTTPFRHHRSMAAVAGRGLARRPISPARRLGENELEWENRLAVEELEKYLQEQEPTTSRERERLRDEQVKAIRDIRTNILFPDNYVSKNRTPSPERPHTPPGLPNRDPNVALELASLMLNADKKQKNSNVKLPIITRGVMFGDLKRIPTDPRVDPPPNSCISCWEKGHERSKCPNPYKGYCRNCGRRGVTLTTCPRCSEIHIAKMLKKFGKRNYELFRDGRMKKVQKKRSLSIHAEATTSTASVPTASVPTASVPTASIPTASVPTASVPTASVPTASIPTASVPTASVPTASVPTASIPTASVPTASIPTASVPTASVPTVEVQMEGAIGGVVPSLPSSMDAADRLVDQTRELAQALRGLPDEVIMMAMREFFEARRRSNQ